MLTLHDDEAVVRREFLRHPCRVLLAGASMSGRNLLYSAYDETCYSCEHSSLLGKSYYISQLLLAESSLWGEKFFKSIRVFSTITTPELFRWEQSDARVVIEQREVGDVLAELKAEERTDHQELWILEVQIVINNSTPLLVLLTF